MLKFDDKITILKAYLTDIKDTYSDSFKTDILFYFDEFENLQVNDLKLNFLKNLKSKEEIKNWVDNLTSKIVIKFNEDEEQLSDFIFYTLNP